MHTTSERGGEGGGFNFFMVLVRSEASCEEIKRGEIDNLSKFQTRGRTSQKQIQRRRAERRVGTINTSWKIRSGDDEPASLPPLSPLSSLPSFPCSPPPSPPPVALSRFRLRRPVCSVPVRLLKPFSLFDVHEISYICTLSDKVENDSDLIFLCRLLHRPALIDGLSLNGTSLHQVVEQFLI